MEKLPGKLGNSGKTENAYLNWDSAHAMKKIDIYSSNIFMLMVNEMILPMSSEIADPQTIATFVKHRNVPWNQGYREEIISHPHIAKNWRLLCDNL